MSWTAARIQALRKRLRLKQQEFAVLLGVHIVTISRWEQGHHVPTSLAEEKLDELDKKTPDAQGSGE